MPAVITTGATSAPAKSALGLLLANFFPPTDPLEALLDRNNDAGELSFIGLTAVTLQLGEGKGHEPAVGNRLRFRSTGRGVVDMEILLHHSLFKWGKADPH